MEEPRYIDPFTDVGFKTLFLEPRNNDLLLSLINAVFETLGEPVIRSAKLSGNEHPGLDARKKRVVQDLECVTEQGVTLIVEVQLAREVDFAERLGFYGMRAAIVQTQRGDPRYALVPVCVLCFMNFIHRKGHPEILHLAETQFRDNQERFIDTPRYILVEVPKFHKPSQDLRTSFEEWIWSLGNMGQISEAPPIVFKDPIMQHLYQEAEIANFSAEEKKSYFKSLEESRHMYYALEYAKQQAAEMVAKGIADGLAKGLEQGLEQGAAKGKAEGELLLIDRMLGNGADWATITKLTGITPEECEQLRIIAQANPG